MRRDVGFLKCLLYGAHAFFGLDWCWRGWRDLLRFRRLAISTRCDFSLRLFGFGLRLFLHFNLLALSALRPDQVLERDELMTVLLKNSARKGASPTDENFLVVLFQFFDERNEIAVTTNNDKGVDVIACERHLQRIESQIDV